MKKATLSATTSKPNVLPKPRKSFLQKLFSKSKSCEYDSREFKIPSISSTITVATKMSSIESEAIKKDSDNCNDNEGPNKTDTLSIKNNGIKSNLAVENTRKFINCWHNKVRNVKSKNVFLATSWKTIRVFVSSTFTDMHNEREILVKKVFHKLRLWCEARKFHLVECDLRWGVPKDTMSATTITVCLEELDRCMEENDDKPFFICTLGERYGWIPTEAEVNEEIRTKYDWEPNVSITHMEILHGAYRLENPNALFCFRNSNVLSDIPDEYKNKFVDEDQFSIQQLKILKDKLKSKFKDQYFDYDSQYYHLDMSTGKEKVFLKIHEDFETKIFDFLTNAIKRQYPDNENSTEFTPEEQDDFIHNSSFYLKSNFIVGRKDELETIMKFIEGDGGKVGHDGDCLGMLTVRHPDEDADVENKFREQLHLECETFKIDESSSRFLCVTGDPGVGKCTIVSHVGRLVSEQNKKLFFHNVTCTTNGMTWTNVVHRLIRFLSKEQFQAINEENENNPEFLMDLLGKSLKRVKEDVVIIVYGLEKLDNSDATNCLSWLPPRYPSNVKVIVCVHSNQHVCESRLVHKDAYFLKVKPFSDADAEKFVREYLSKFNKKLDQEQMECLLANQSSRQPIWLSITCEELRIYGDFDTLSNKIKSFPSNLKDLLKEIVHRLIREDDTKLLIKLLSLLVSSYAGLPESDLLKLLGDPANGVEVPMVTWATLKSYLKPFITMTSAMSGKMVKVKLSYDALIEVLKSTMLTEKTSKEWHKYLADYFEYYNQDDYFIYDDLVHNLYCAGLWKRMTDFYRTNVRTSSLNSHHRSDILKRVRCDQRILRKSSQFTYEVMACSQCSEKSNLISILTDQTKDVCFICGSLVASKEPGKVAYLCTMHGFNFKNKCIFCQGITGSSTRCTQLYLCNSCSVGRGSKRCCLLLERQ